MTQVYARCRRHASDRRPAKEFMLLRLLTDEENALLKIARTAAGSAYCPYSRFPVGAAVETDKGVFTGCNIENASYGLAVCAERVAIFSAVANGAKSFVRLAVSCIASHSGDPPGSRMPCGACRQVIAEFMPQDSIILVDGNGAWTVAAMLPTPFLLTHPDNKKETSTP